MGITTKDYFENIYNVLFSPINFFGDEDVTISTRQAFGTVLFVTIFSLIAQGIANKTILSITYPFTFFMMIFGVIILWFLTGLFFEYISKIFTNENRLNKILFYTSFAMVPYIFFAPLDVIKHSGETGYSVGVILEMLLYFWIIFLYVLAIKKSYNITTARAFMMLTIPFISIFFAFTWAISFCAKMGYINSI